MASLAQYIEDEQHWLRVRKNLFLAGVTAIRPVVTVPDYVTEIVDEFFSRNPPPVPQPPPVWLWNYQLPSAASPTLYALVCGNHTGSDKKKVSPERVAELDALLARFGAEPARDFYPVPSQFDRDHEATTYRVFLGNHRYFELREGSHLGGPLPNERPYFEYWGFLSEQALRRGLHVYLYETGALGPLAPEPRVGMNW